MKFLLKFELNIKSMVKFKSRYLLIELQYQNETNNGVKLFDANQLYNNIIKQIKFFFGDSGVGKIRRNFQVKYNNNFTNLVIMRIGKEYLDILWTVLNLITNIEGHNLRFKIINVSGTIKKVEVHATEYLKNWLINYEKTKATNNLCK
jgi:RNase P/RNase MRP subunit POP5